jgi:hypothetical protein
VKKAILCVLLLEVFDRGRLAMLSNANEVMPSEDLVKDNAVKKAAQPEA